MKKYNFSLRALALAVATLFVAAGCSDDSSTEEGGGSGNGNGNGGGNTQAIQLAVSEIQGTSATVATTPTSNSLTYMVDVVAKDDFETYASAEAFAAADVEAIKAEALSEGSTLAEYLVATGVLRSGAKSEQFAGLEVSTDYVAFAYGLSMEGEITTGVATKEFTTLENDPEPEKGPEVEAVVIPGVFDDNGELANKESAVTVGVALSNETDVVTSIYEFFAPTRAIENVLEAYDLTYEELLDIAVQGQWAEVYTYTANDIAYLNEKRIIAGGYGNLDPETSYTAIIQVTGSNGISSFVDGSATTESAGEATDAYKAWLGTWTVTSASAEYSKEAKTFDITISQRYANHSYLVSGLTSSIFREMGNEEGIESIYPKALFHAESGKLSIANQLIFADENENGPYEFYYNFKYRNSSAGKDYVNNQDDIVGLVGTLNADGQSGTIAGNELQSTSGQSVGTVLYMDYFYWYLSSDGSDYTAIYGCTPAQMFTYYEETDTEHTKPMCDYPIAPYTLVKKDTTEPAPTPTTPEASKKLLKKVGARHSSMSMEHNSASLAFPTINAEKSSKVIYRNSDVETLRSMK